MSAFGRGGGWWGMVISQHAMGQTPHVNRMTDTCKNLGHNFVAAGKVKRLLETVTDHKKLQQRKQSCFKVHSHLRLIRHELFSPTQSHKKQVQQ